ncbi:GNAT family N-acetyltransferase [Nocardioides insulae]|uniref:GNAT family N-acetyltransferase n=1 Tax=Nocardioides insulae TaxID=394734 RepID=UPI0003F697FA|nr:GNAT family N-acetyltransferase [Nocardioides insulae]
MNDDTQTPVSLPDGWTARAPELDDLPRLLELRGGDKQPFTGSGSIAEAGVEAEIAGLKSWTRRQLVAIDPDGEIRAWVSAHDRAAGRVLIYLYVDRATPERAAVAAGLYAWVAEQGRLFAGFRGLDGTQLDASPFADDSVQQAWLADAGFRRVRTWLQMTRPVTPEEAKPEVLPQPRAGVTIRQVATHDNGMPVATDLQTVHVMLEESFQDHFNSYRESFAEFVQRLREDPGHRWDHWWLAYVDDPEDPTAEPLPAGALVASVLPPDQDGVEGSFVEYIGVHRRARGRGVAKALLFAVIADAAERGRNRVGLEVDADSPTGADGLYTSLGWVTDYATESWHRDVTL